MILYVENPKDVTGNLLEWIVILLFRGSSWPKDSTRISGIVDILYRLQAQKDILALPNRTELFLWHNFMHKNTSNIVLEVLATAIGAEKEIKGIQIK